MPCLGTPNYCIEGRRMNFHYILHVNGMSAKQK